jgi:hypothetical protein
MFPQTETVGHNEMNLLELGFILSTFLVPLIAVFTKYDQFTINIEIDLERTGRVISETEADTKAEEVFREQYLGKLEGMPDFVRLESEVLENNWTFRR